MMAVINDGCDGDDMMKMVVVLVVDMAVLAAADDYNDNDGSDNAFYLYSCTVCLWCVRSGLAPAVRPA